METQEKQQLLEIIGKLKHFYMTVKCSNYLALVRIITELEDMTKTETDSEHHY